MSTNLSNTDLSNSNVKAGKAVKEDPGAKKDMITAKLNDLIETCRDGEAGFKEAAGAVTDPALKTLFNSLSRQREELCQELASQVKRLGGEPEKSGHASAALHRGWINLKQAITGKDDKAIVDEAERGEDVAVQSYQAALKEELPPDIRTLITRQSALVKEAHDRVSALKRSYNQPKA